MALRFWLPLNGNATNKGICNVTTMTGSPSSWGTGKMGKCATFTGVVANSLYCDGTTLFQYTDNFS